MNRNLEFILRILGVYLIGLSVFTFPIKFKYNLVSIQSDINIFSNYKNSIIYLVIGILMFVLMRIIKGFKNIKIYHIKYIFSIISLILFLCLFIFLHGTNNINKLLMPIPLVIGYISFIRAELSRIINDNFSSEQNFDGYITKKSEDTLNRVQLAERIYDIIVDSSNETTSRVGVCGKWGEGKTSLLYLIREKADTDNNIIVWFNPWVYGSDKEIWLGFRNSFENGINLYSQGVLNPSIFRYLRSFFLRLINSQAPKLIIGKWFDEILKNPNSFEKDKLKNQINKYIETTLPKNGKIIIFIDDLDRIEDSKLILKLLMGIKEILDFKKVTYVIGFDDSIISKVIEKELPTNSGKQFLEKIIDYVIYLPNPNSFEKVSYLEKELLILDGRIKKEIILDLIPFMPDNPRTIKRFIYNLSILNSTLKRFDEDELNWHFLYLGRLLMQEFPTVFQNILRKKDLLDFFTYDSIISERFGHLSDTKKEEIDIIPSLTEGITESINTQRLKIIIDGLRSFISYSKTEGDPIFYFRVIETPTLMTRKEFKKHLKDIGEEVRRINNLSEFNKQEYISRLFDVHNNLLAKIVDSLSKDEMDINRFELRKIDRQIDDLIFKEKIFKTLNEKFLIQLFEKILSITNYWRSFQNDYYIEFRENEKKWLKELLVLNEISVLNIAEMLYGEFEVDKNKKLMSELRQWFEPRFIEEFFTRFKTEDISTYLFIKKRIFLRLLLNKNGSFHKSENYSRLKCLIEEAKSNLLIRTNFYNLLLIILNNDSIFEIGDSKELRGNFEFVKIIWSGFSSGRWNRRTIGSLEEKMKIIINIFQENGEEFFYPEWWEEIKNSQ